MAVELAKAYVTLVPSFTGAQGAIAKGLGDLGGAGGKGGRALGAGILGGFRSAIGPIAGIAAAAFGVKAIVNFGKAGVDALSRIQEIQAQTVAVIKSTGGAANVTGADIFHLTRKLEDMTATEAESIQQGANLLLTFKNIRNEAGKGNDIFNQATTSLVDMARAMGTDPQSAAIQLGKALNDPIKGIAALARVGVQFTAGQKDMITSMVESGNVMGAQKIILKELNDQFGGSGAAYAATYAGKIDMLKDAFGGVQERLVGGLMPTFGKLATSATDALNAIAFSPLFEVIMGKLADFGAGLATKFEGVATAITNIGQSGGITSFGALLDKLTANSPALAVMQTVFTAMAPIMPTIAAALAQIAPQFAALLVAVAPLIPQLTSLVIQLLPPLVQLLVAVTPALVALIQALAPIAAAIAPLIAGTAQATNVLKIFATEGTAAAVQAALGTNGAFGDMARGAYSLGQSIGDTFRGVVANVQSFAATTVSTITGWSSGTVSRFAGWVGSTSSQFTGWASSNAARMAGWASQTAGQIAGWVGQTAGQFGGWAGRVGAQILTWAGQAVGHIASFASRGYASVSSFWTRTSAAFASGVSRAVGFIASLPGRALGALGNAGGILVSSGRALVQGFINGILGMIGRVASAVNNVVQAARNFFPNSPAKTGPFSGSGWRKLKESGGAIMDQFESGLRPVVVPLSASVGMAGFGSSRVYAPSPAGGYGAAPTVNMTVNNPVNEPTSETSRRASQLIGAALAV